MTPDRNIRAAAWGADIDLASGAADGAPFKPLTRVQAAALRAAQPTVSPWRVVLAQAGVGVLAALLGAVWLGEGVGSSVLYGAVVVVLPAALMARGMTSRLSSVSPAGSALSFMVWEMLKIGVSVALLLLAPTLVAGLVWPALLVGLVVCIKVYWVALLWRGRTASV